MPIADKDIRWVQAPRMGLLEQLYLPAIVEGPTQAHFRECLEGEFRFSHALVGASLGLPQKVLPTGLRTKSVFDAPSHAAGVAHACADSGEPGVDAHQ